MASHRLIMGSHRLIWLLLSQSTMASHPLPAINLFQTSNQGVCHPLLFTWRVVEAVAQFARANWSKEPNVLFGHVSLAGAAFAGFAVIVLGAIRWFV